MKYTTLLVIVLFFLATANCLDYSNKQRVLLRDLTSLTLFRGQHTTGRRSSPVPQLECVGGTANGKYSPKAVQCYNRGWDGRDVQWECKTEMPMDYQFGKIEVSCEGFDYPEDPYVLAGSCGLRYELDYSQSGVKRASYYPKKLSSWFNWEMVGYAAIVLFILFLVYHMATQRGDTYGSGGSFPGSGGGGGGGGGGGWGPDNRPPPPGWNPPPPSYDDATQGGKGTGGTSSSGSGGPGFYSGLGLGALGGYFFGRQSDGYGGYSRYRGTGRSSFFGGNNYDSGYTDYDGSGPSTSYNSGPSTSYSSSTHTSSGYGSTSRR